MAEPPLKKAKQPNQLQARCSALNGLRGVSNVACLRVLRTVDALPVSECKLSRMIQLAQKLYLFFKSRFNLELLYMCVLFASTILNDIRENLPEECAEFDL